MKSGRGLKVLVGAQPAQPEAVVQSYLDGNLNLGQNICDL